MPMEVWEGLLTPAMTTAVITILIRQRLCLCQTNVPSFLAIAQMTCSRCVLRARIKTMCVAMVEDHAWNYDVLITHRQRLGTKCVCKFRVCAEEV